MDSTTLTLSQIQRTLRTIRRHEHYLARLTGRMHQKHFPHTDPLKIAADDAEKAIAKLVDVLKRMEQVRSGPEY